MRRYIPVLVLTAALLSPVPAAAADCDEALDCTAIASSHGDVIRTAAHRTDALPSDDVPARRRATPGGESTARTDWVELAQEYLTPACLGNGLHGAEELCATAVTSCGPARVRYWIWHQYVDARREADGSITRTARPWEQLPGSYCLGDDDPGVPDYGRAIARVQAGFQDLPLPHADVVVAPAPTSLVQVPTAFYAGGVQVFEQTVTPVPGIRVTVRAEPTSWTWHWGDGTSATFDTAGEPRRPVVAHTYAQARDHSAFVEVSWKGTFTVGGSTEVFDIAAPAVVRSAPVTVQVREARTRLVAG